jgi:hypothetical protein
MRGKKRDSRLQRMGRKIKVDRRGGKRKSGRIVMIIH